MEDNVIIRKTELRDAEQYVRLNIFVWRCAYKDIFPESVFIEREKKIERNIQNFSKHQLENPNGISYVAEVDGKIVGIMSGLYLSENVYFKEQGFADLKALYVHPDFQHIGIGRALFEVFASEIKKKGKTKFVIGVLKDNKKARCAYEKWCGELNKYTSPFVIDNKEYAEVFYTYDLTKENKKGVKNEIRKQI